MGMSGIEPPNIAQRKTRPLEAALIEAVEAGIWIHDLSGRLLEANQALCRLLGVDRQRLLQMPVQDLVPDLLEQVGPLTDSQPVVLDTELPTPDGGRIAVELESRLVDYGALPAVLTFVRGTSARPRSALEFAKLSRAVEQSSSTVMITDVHGDIEYVNPKFSQVAGYQPEEVIGQNPRLLKSGRQSPEFYRELWETISAGREWRGDFINRKKNGQFYWELASISPVRDVDGKVTHYLKVGEDITERKQAEEALQRRNRQLELLNRASQAFNSTLDLDEVLLVVLSEVRFWLQVVAASIWLVDQETGELVCRQSSGPHPEVVRGWRLAPGQGIAGWVVNSGESVLVEDAKKDERHYGQLDQLIGLESRSILCVPLRTRQKLIGVLEAVDQDVGRFDAIHLTLAELLATSAAIAIENAGLYEQAQLEIAERKQIQETLYQRTLELQERNDELDAFSHTVAHDLKTPLSLVLGYAQLLHAQRGPLSEDEFERYTRPIAVNARKMEDIIQELLLLASVRREDVQAEPLEMGEVVSEALGRLDYLIEANQAEIVVPGNWPIALGYGPWVEEVWVNYVSNAIKYGGRPPRVELGAAAPDGGAGPVRFWARDNGPGLTEEKQSQLFVPFTRLGQVRIKGHGLGLSIVRRIVEKLGGQAGVKSSGVPGEGAEFFFTLPRP
jgi:PAS domain S-box-containing protein